MRRGLSLVEVLMVCAILMILAALSFPLLTSMKRAGKISKSASNLHQLQLAFAIYRTEHDGDGVTGPASQMGLPSLVILWASAHASMRLPQAVWNSPCGQHADGPSGMLNYGYYPTDDVDGSWHNDISKLGEDIVLLDDFHCNPSDLNLHNPFRTKFAIGVTLAGSVKRKASQKAISNAFWYP